jgi:hypothetical protein
MELMWIRDVLLQLRDEWQRLSIVGNFFGTVSMIVLSLWTHFE